MNTSSLLHMPVRRTTVAAVLLVVLACLVVGMLAAKRNALVTRVTRLEHKLVKMNDLAMQRSAGPAAPDFTAILKKRDKGFSLFSFLDRAIGQADARRHIVSIEPGNVKKMDGFQRQEAVVVYEKGSFKTLLHLLQAIEQPSEACTVRSLTIRRADKKSPMVNARITVVTVQ